MESIDRIMEGRAKEIYNRKRDYQSLFYLIIIVLLLTLVYLEHQENKILIRNHNFKVMTETTSCSDSENIKLYDDYRGVYP